MISYTLCEIFCICARSLVLVVLYCFWIQVYNKMNRLKHFKGVVPRNFHNQKKIICYEGWAVLRSLKKNLVKKSVN